jgi:hypothetical protein
MARRWVDRDIVLKTIGGLALLGASTAMYFSGIIWPYGWGLGALLLCWGLFSIGDKKSEWE